LAAGSLAFLAGLGSLMALTGIEGSPRRKLFEVNLYLSTAVVYLALGGVLVAEAASALGGAGSHALRPRLPRYLGPALLAVFPLAIAAGQWHVSHPERIPWVFPLWNLAILSIPSLAIVSIVTARYLAANRLSWPVSWREWTSAFVYGAVGATFVAALINTGYMLGMGAWLVDKAGRGDIFPLSDSLRTLPRGWAVFYDLTTLSVVAPLNEEFWKGLIVALFFFRKGGVARCFLWGVLAGAGFNLLETFDNSLRIVSPSSLAAKEVAGQWWLFAVARGGTAAVHACASGLSALAFYGLLQQRWRLAALYPAAAFVHGSWNFLTYTLQGDRFPTHAAPDSAVLDVFGTAGLLVLAGACLAVLWTLSRQLRDERPAAIYVALGVLPSPPLAAVARAGPAAGFSSELSRSAPGP
jgi:hypothetical protein